MWKPRRRLMRTEAPELAAVDLALSDGERKGFRLAVIGRTCALVPIALFYFATYGYPNNVYIAGLILVTAAAGLVPLSLVGSRFDESGAMPSSPSTWQF